MTRVNVMLFIIMSVPVISTASKIHFSDRNNSWVTFGAGSSMFCPFNRSLSYGTDTMIGGKIYGHLVSSVNPISTSGCYLNASLHDYLIREDTLANIVYYRDYESYVGSDTNEHVYFDYNLRVGDTIRFKGNTARDTVVMFDSVIILGVYHYVYTLWSNGTESAYTFVEGIGSLKCPYLPFMDACEYSYEQLACFSKGGATPDFSVVDYNCYIIPPDTFQNIASCSMLSVKLIQKPGSVVTIAPNPATDGILINALQPLPGNTFCTVYDIAGRKIYNSTAIGRNGTDYILSNQWKEGLYLIVIECDGVILAKDKVMVKR